MQAKKYFTSKAAFRSGPSANGPLLRRTGRRCGDMRRLLHKCILRIKGHGAVFAGVIGFVDLIAPHIARKLFGADHRTLIPMSAVTGGIFMVLCDLIARIVIVPNELPVGVVTALIGAPFFAFVFFKRRTGR